ncbi:BTAD domain-containing putative transcriptional regulator [Plantactinospora mayteni]
MFGVLGPLAVWTSAGVLVPVPGLKVRALLADLLVHEGRPVPVDRLIEDLWGDQPPGNPAGALHTKISQLRRTLATAEPGRRDMVQLGEAGYRIDIPSESVDAGRFTDLTTRAHAAPEPESRASLLTEALALWRGPAYADFADEFLARQAINRLTEQRLAAQEELAEARLELGDHALVAAELTDLVAHHPWRERLRASQLRALYLSGRQHEALAVYDEFRRRLSDELGVDPGPELVALHQAILRQDPGLRPRAAATPVTRRRTNVPAPTSVAPDGGLIGRAEQLATVRARLAEGRLVTLTGPGGVGKTRLAVEVARTTVHDFADGTWVVELASQPRRDDPVVAREAISEAVAATLGIREDAAPGLPVDGEPIGVADRLASSLRSRRLLLVLDNCEHVVEPVAHLTERLLGAVPGLRVLATSREPLRLGEEVALPVPPLAMPEAGAAPAEVAQASAVRLFVARATAADPGFSLGPDNAEMVATICRRLDGIPLALELAATRVRAVELPELAKRLDDRFGLLSAGQRTAPARQRTLRAMIDWSWELLPPAERAVLRRFAVFPDGCTLAAAEQVCAGGEVSAADVVDLLARLVDRSLVAVRDSDAGRRYQLLESVRAYCREKLDGAGDARLVRRQHVDYYTTFAEHAAARLRGHHQHEALRQLDQEAGNLRSALEDAATLGRPDLSLRLVNSLGWYWLLRGRHQEARRALTTALATAPTGDDDGARLRAMTWLTGIAARDHRDLELAVRRQHVLDRHAERGDPAGQAFAQWLFAFTMLGSGDMAVATELVTLALAGFRRLGDRWGIAAALGTRADLALVQGDLDTVRRDCEESRSLFEQLGDRWGQGLPTNLLATLAEIRGDYQQAERMHRSALQIAEELRLWPSVSRQLAGLGRLSLMVGDDAAATDYHEKALRVAEEQSNRSAAAFAATGLALGDRRHGRLAAAETRQRELLDWNRHAGYLPGVALTLAELGFIAEQRGDASSAQRLHTEGLVAARATGDPRAIALALEGLAGTAVLLGDHHRAARLCGAAEAARASVGAPLPAGQQEDVVRIAAAIREVLGVAGFAVECRRGGELSLDDVAALPASK